MIESDKRNNRVHALRLVCSLAIVGIAAFALPAVSSAFEDGTPAAFGEADGLHADALLGGIESLDWNQNPLNVLDALEDAAAASGNPSDEFFDEAGFPTGAYETRANRDGSVASCMLDSDEADAFEAVSSKLEAKGWIPMPLKGISGATFVKQSGCLRWALVTCTQVGTSTCAVYRLVA